MPRPIELHDKKQGESRKGFQMADNYNSIDPMDQNGEQEEVVDLQESQNFEEDDDQAGTVDQQDDGDTGEGAENSDSGSADQKTRQTREDNAAARAARIRATREAERTARAAALKEADDRIAKQNIRNPYTGEMIRSVEDFEKYSKKVKEDELKEKAEETGKSVEELMEEDEDKAYIRKKRQEESEAEVRTKKAAEDNARISTDLEDFMQKHPDVDAGKLIANQKFLKFCGDRLGRNSLDSLYNDYLDIVGTAHKESDDRADRSTGTGNTGGVVLSPKQKAALADWNRQYPDMKMTPKDFLSM